jgi:hypothetical protein
MQLESDREPIAFNILKTQTKKERIFVVLFFVNLCILFFYILVNCFGDKFIIRLFIGIISLVVLGIERLYDHIIRTRIIGKGKLYSNKICLNKIDYEFKQIDMMWVNNGLNTKSIKDLFSTVNDYETLKLH